MKSNWINCPICDEPDMRQTTDIDGNKLIFCVNHACRSNGGDYESPKKIGDNGPAPKNKPLPPPAPPRKLYI